MNKQQQIAWPVLVLLLISASGCAFTPQKAALAPVVNVMASSEGKGITVAVRVVDERPSKSLGHRGTAYGASAEITSTEDVALLIQRQLIKGLKIKGFQVVDYDVAKEPRLTVEVRLLDYSTQMGFWTGGVNVQGALKVVAQAKGATYERMYRTERKERVVIVPTAKKNEDWISTVLGEVMDQLFEDVGLFKFLAAKEQP